MTSRVVTAGKHLALDGAPFKVRGVTYGSFAPRLDGSLFPERFQIKEDLAAMSRLGLNTVRTYTLPPTDLLELAEENGLRVIVGLDYRDWRYEESPGRAAHRRVRDEARRAVDAALQACSGNATVLAIAVGNEVPGDVTRLHGPREVAEILSELVARVHAGDEDMLATYSNYPTTEYLEIAGQDLACFNVFLEEEERLKAYIGRLQVVTGDIPLMITELGLAATIHGEEAQAAALEWQLRAVDEGGCAGATVFSWTDEWAVDGKPVEGWGFGITDDDRNERSAVGVVKEWARRSMRDLREVWPTVTAVVCAYNQEKVLQRCLSSLVAVDYPGFEIIVCDDGSTDATAEISRRFPVRLLELPHSGLSVARNAGIQAATGEIVAFIDVDAACHPEWPYHLALSLEGEAVVATGGPNSPMPDAAFTERAVAQSPGGPIHVLITDDRAEHVPGCNMAFLKEALVQVDGFDPIYTAAGDDVDVCWKILDRGREIGFSPAAQVWHHRRDSVSGYLRQQRGYGRAERLLQSRHRHRFNRLGQARWSGFIYGGPRPLSGFLQPVVYHGYQGSAPYQGVVHRPSEHALGWAGALLPITVAVGLLGFPLAWLSLWSLVLPAALLLGLIAYAGTVAAGVHVNRTEPRPVALKLLAGALHVLQPLWRGVGPGATRQGESDGDSNGGNVVGGGSWPVADSASAHARSAEVRGPDRGA